jgi:hypothetical protein
MGEKKDDIWHGSRLKEIPEHIKQYIKTRIDLLKLSAIENLSQAAGWAALGILLFFFGLFGLIFLSISLAFAIGSLLGSYALGFLIVAALFIISGVIIFVMRKKLLLNPIINGIIKAVYHGHEE